MRRTPFQKLKALQRLDLRAQAREDRKRRIREAWERLVHWEAGLSLRTRELARLVTTVGVISGIMQHPVRWVVRLYRARTVDRAELPRTGVPSTAEDYIKDPWRH